MLIILAPIYCYAQISPGDLTQAHAQFEGLSNCTKCHVLGKQLSNNNCLNCHIEIKMLQSTNQGYHSSLEVKNKGCWKCHSEHNGRDFRIINFSPDKFDHNKAGFILKGKHARLKCSQCHQSKFNSGTPFNKRKDTYLGLNSKCITCHEDVHQGTLGKNCGSCHNIIKFKPAAFFNHDTTEFKLEGAHITTACSKCHIKETLNGKPFQKFAGLQFKECTSCHIDVHKGKFGNNCENCHNSSSFKVLNKNSFNHDKTKFPLLGAHIKVSCADCHGKNPLSKPKFAKCTDCHKDAHFGEFTVNNSLKDCKECHSIQAFDIPLFTFEDHNKTEFHLSGAHMAVPCQSCHLKKDTKKKEWHFKNIGLKCIDCHENIHGTEITLKFMQDNNCGNCHSTGSWNKVSFNHDLTGFKLWGKHSDVKCNECHEEKNNTGKTVYIFVSLKPECSACHHDVHLGQFDSDAKEYKSVCENCHGFKNWQPVKFDHQKTSFPLNGAHEKVACSGCHKVKEVNGKVFINYKLENFKCASCHA